MKGSKNLFKKSDPNFGSEKNKPAFGRFKEQKLLRVAIKFFAQILHKIPSFWDFPFMIFNKRLSAHHFFVPKTVMRNFDKNGDVHLDVYSKRE